ncbi:hypothetical protein PTTG_27331 [Puccinia triticina 1-1 BBBD Race 1]|uniref:Uncharacterized protein n=1 Tax=Puccinia triticina (isolate 1-1 / race 1 (BBBD)) TaxID=630390 RepID=A0A180GM05_PUCT1|nr:hypothetical protein PTTG_27331 [Puccinia triticina 1-1 BBBD Race 1]
MTTIPEPLSPHLPHVPSDLVRVASQAISRTPRVHPAGHEDHAHIITPSRIITDSGGRPGPALDPHIQQPIITPTHIGGPVITPSRIIGSPVITPSRIIHSGSGSRAPSIHRQPSVGPITHPPPDPMSEDKTRDEEPPRGSTSDDKAYSVYGSMDGFIRPPPPRGLPSITIPSEDRELPPAHSQTPSAANRRTPVNRQTPAIPQPPQTSAAVHRPPQTPTTHVHTPAHAAQAPAPPCQVLRAANDPLVESLLASAQLSDTDLQLARQLFNAPERSHWSLTVVMWMTQRRAAALPAAPVAANGTAHVYSQVFWTRVRQTIREILMRSTLESYSRAQSAHGHIFVHSPLPLIQNYVLEQSPAFRRQHLPAGIPQNNKSMAGLVTFLQSMVKHERTHMRNLLLSNVRQESRPQELGPVPRLFDLIVTINRSFQPRGVLRGPADIRQDLNTGVMVRIAMLRLLTVHHLIHRAPGDTRSQWDLIDDQLESVRQKSDVELQA